MAAWCGCSDLVKSLGVNVVCHPDRSHGAAGSGTGGMNYPTRLLVCAVVALLGHLLLIRARSICHRKPRRRDRGGAGVLRAPPPEPEKPAEPEATPEPQEQPTHQPQRRRAMAEAPRRENLPKPLPRQSAQHRHRHHTTPVFGISMESTSSPAWDQRCPWATPCRQSQRNAKVAAATGVKPLAAPAQAYEVTKMPFPWASATGKYTRRRSRLDWRAR